jgi:hypothetical protein
MEGFVASWRLLLVVDSVVRRMPEYFKSFKMVHFRQTGLKVLFTYSVSSFLFRFIQLTVSALDELVIIFSLSPVA